MKRTALFASLLVTVVLGLALASVAVASASGDRITDVRSLYEDAYRSDTPSVFGVRHSPLDAFLRDTLKSTPPVVFAPPSSYDLRTLGRLTPVRDQDPYGTCWSFATYGSLESRLLPGETYDLSENNMVWFSGFDYEPYNGGGNYWMSTAYLARWDGPVLESDDPYKSAVHPDPDSVAKQKHVQDVLILPGKQGTACDEIKYAIMNGGGVATYMYASGWSSYFDETRDGYYYPDAGAMDSDHAVLIVGWDDAYPASNFKDGTEPPGNGAFIVRNSWGTGWGEDGYFYASYYDKHIGVDAWSFSGAEANDNYGGVYQYDPLGCVNSWGYNGVTTLWFANVFTATETASVTAAGFWTVYSGLSYEVWAGSSLASMTQRGSGALADAGYHTVDLTTPLPVTSSQPFAIAVKLIGGAGEYFHAPLEYPLFGYSSAAQASAGQSFVSQNGTTWAETSTAFTANSNVCLKAFTAPTGPPAPPVVTSPNGGEDWQIGSQHAITWTGGGGGTATIELSRDGGATWPETLAPDTANDGSFAWTVTGPETTGAKVRVTTDHGQDASNASFAISEAPPAPEGWSEQVSGTDTWLDAVAFADGEHGWAVGWEGTIITTSNGGATWTPQTSGVADDLKGVAFASPLTGWAVGEYGVLLRTTNAGGTWTPSPSGTTWDLDDVEAISATTAVAVGMDGVFKTTDGGLSWQHKTSGLADVEWLRGVDFVSPDYSWAVGWDGEVYRTTNGGASWRKQVSGVSIDLESVCFLDSRRGWAVGASGTVIGTTDGGATWFVVGVPTGEDLNDIVLIGAELGWIVGDDGTLLKATDEGITWVSQSLPGSPWLRSAAFADEMHGWTVGLSGHILRLSPGATDITPPHTVLTGASDRWRRLPLTLTLTATAPSGVQRTEARIDEGTWQPVAGSSVSVPAPTTHESDGLHRVDYRSIDDLDNVESYHSTEVRIDTRRPATKAPKPASVRKGQYVRLYYKVSDLGQNAGVAAVTIKIKTLRGTTKKTLKLGSKAVNTTLSHRFKCGIAKGKYRFFVYATDPAGNTQSTIGKNYLYVR